MTDTTTELADETAVDDEPQLLQAAAVVDLTGCTYRQLDYWTRIGAVAAGRALTEQGLEELHLAGQEPTSGHARTWTPNEARAIRRAVTVTRAFPHLTADVVFRIARSTSPLDLGHGIVVTTPWSET